MSVIKGPWDLYFGANVLAGIEGLDLSYDVDSDDFKTLQGHSYEVDGAHKVVVTATFLETDVPALAAVLPQYFVHQGGTLSTGETVTATDGAIDVVPGGGDALKVKTDLVVVSSDNPAQTTRIPRCTTEISGVEIDKVRKVKVKFRGESTVATVQFFKTLGISIVS